MGLTRQMLPFFRELILKQVHGRILSYGVQRIGFSCQEAKDFFCLEDSYKFESTPFGQVEFFKMLGFEIVVSIDICNKLIPTHLHDMNTIVPESLFGRYDAILDGGTLEHLFNVPQALENTVKMLKKGGTVIHLLPMNNMVNHGFYQFSPGLFFDFYAANGFKGCILAFAEKDLNLSTFGPRDIICPCISSSNSILCFMATKHEFLPKINTPIQFCYNTHTYGLIESIGKKTFFIWGTGGGFRNVYREWLDENKAFLNFQGFIDSSVQRQQAGLNGDPVYSPEVLRNHPGCIVIVATTYWQEICGIVDSLGTPVRLIK